MRRHVLGKRKDGRDFRFENTQVRYVDAVLKTLAFDSRKEKGTQLSILCCLRAPCARNLSPALEKQ